MPEVMNTCPQCGNQIEAAYQVCPNCGAQQPRLGFVGKLRNGAGALLATRQTHPKQWMIGGGVAAVVVIGAVVWFGGFLGPSSRDICLASLNQAKDFGVISPSATLASSSAKTTDVKNRRQCTAQVDGDTFTILTDLKSEDAEHKKCTDIKKQKSCVAIYSVARSDGMTTYQVREIPPDETDEALAAETPPPAAPGATPAEAPADSSGLDGETAVDNSSAPAQSAPPAQQQPPQQ